MEEEDDYVFADDEDYEEPLVLADAEDDVEPVLELEEELVEIAEEDEDPYPLAAALAATPAVAIATAAANDADDDAIELAEIEVEEAVPTGPQIAAAIGEDDDLTRINGIGPKLQALCYSLGVRRFDQIAKWKKADVTEVDEYLGGFKGRIERDKWVKQAKLLSRGHIAEWESKFGYKS